MGFENNESWEKKYEEHSGSILVAPEISGSKALEMVDMKKINGIYPDLLGKKITDIGSGLGGFIFEIENSCEHVNAVDPLYVSNNKEELLIRDKNRQKNRVNDSIGFLDNNEAKSKEISSQLHELFLLAPSPRNNDEISYLEKEVFKINNVKRLLPGKKEILDGLEKWEKRGFNSSDKITLIGKSGEDTGIDLNTQDYVFIKHLMNKESIDSIKLIKEALRITKPNGKIFIIDDMIKNEEKLLSILDGLNYNYKKEGNLIIIEIVK